MNERHTKNVKLASKLREDYTTGGDPLEYEDRVFLPPSVEAKLRTKAFEIEFMANNIVELTKQYKSPIDMSSKKMF